MEGIKTSINALKRRRFIDISEKNNLIFSIDKHYKLKTNEASIIVKDNNYTTFRIGSKFFKAASNSYSFIDNSMYYFTSMKEAIYFRDNNSREHLLKALCAEVSLLLPDLAQSKRVFRIETYLNKLNNSKS